MVYVKDDLREKGLDNITTPGKKGSKVTTTTYTVNETTGKIEEHIGEPVITPATETVVKVAAKDKVTYKKQGDNVVKTTTVYTVNPENGNITEVSTDEVTQPNGVKDKVVTEDIEPKVVHVKDDLREKDLDNITTPGKKGSIEPKVVYAKDDTFTNHKISHNENFTTNNKQISKKELPLTGSSTTDVYALLALASATLMLAKRKQDDQ